jgi:ADP-heptose:LPS heptosyltransferase
LKILALQFKYFGDAVLMTPALQSLHTHFPAAEIHLLVPAEITPIFQHLPWLDRVWAMPRKRGKANFVQTWPLLLALRRERFDRSVDFASNDRGAFLSFFIGAKIRLGWAERGGFFGRKYLYNQRVTALEDPLPHESKRLGYLLSGWGIPAPKSFESEIRANPALANAATRILPCARAIVCHVASSQPKKEWPLNHWAKLHQLASGAGYRLVFTTARGDREAALMAELKKLAPDAEILPPIPDLDLFLAVLARAGLFVAGDTGPLHFAAGLGVRTISLFGPTNSVRWAPCGEKHIAITGGKCVCDGNLSVCAAREHCLAQILPEQVFAALQTAFLSA